MGKILCYIYEEMADFEITFLLHRLKNTGKKEIISISSDREIKQSQSGLSYIPDNIIKDIVCLDDVDALIIPGGPIDNNQNDILDLINRMIANDKLVAAICFGPQFLARAGVLDKYKYTTSCSADKIIKLGCEDPFNWENYIDKRVVIDRNLITAQGYAFVDLASAVCRYLNVFESEVQEYEQIGRVKENEQF